MVYLVGGPYDGALGDSPYAGCPVLWFRTHHDGGPNGLRHGRVRRSGAVAYHLARGQHVGDSLRYLHGTETGRDTLGLVMVGGVCQ